MTDTTVEEALAKYGPSEIARSDLLTMDDPGFRDGNVALVTGAGNGIGRATALALAANGLTVVGTDIDQEGLDDLVATAGDLDLPGTVETVAGNLSEDDDLERIVAEAATHGDVRYLANVAGLQTIAPIAEFPVEKYDLMHDVMQRAPFVLAKHCWPHFEDADGTGVVGNMCSVHGHVVTRDKVAYNATKFGLRGLTQSIAAEGGESVRAFTVSTAYVKTELVAKQLPDTAERRGTTVDEVVRDVMLEKTRVEEMMEPSEVANLFVMGFSEHSKHLNGGDMRHDGGMSLTYD